MFRKKVFIISVTRNFYISIKRGIVLLALFMLYINMNTGPVFAQEGSEAKIRIGILCINTETGNLHKEGIEKAIKDHSFYKSGYLALTPYTYAKSNDGFEILEDLIMYSKADIILGPTESDIFVRAVALEDEFKIKKVPVISGLATAKVGNQENGWFFRINVDVNRRTQIIFDFLNQHWINTVAIIYADTEFGRRAEQAFQAELELRGRKSQYTSLLYDTSPDPRKQLYTIFDKRPEAVGFFGEREDILLFYNQFKTMNESFVPYKPMFFTILDISHLKVGEGNFYFASLGGNKGEPLDDTKNEGMEVEALGHDLGKLVLKVLEDMNYDKNLFTTEFDEEKRVDFQKQMARLMNRSNRLENSKTRMIFNDFENTTLPGIFCKTDDKVEFIPIPGHIGWWNKLFHRIHLVFDVYGKWIIFIALLVILILAFLISRMEVRRLFPYKHVHIYKTWIFYLFLAGHILVILAIYIFLSESGSIRYDDIVMVTIIGLTPSAFLRTTFFETRYGKAIGFEGIYKNIMFEVEKRIMAARYAGLEALQNVIAYGNSLDSMKKSLTRVYKNHPSPVQRANLIQKMEESIDREPEYLNKRRICAVLLLKQFDQEQLIAEGFAPQDFDYKNPIDPRIIIRKAAKHCAKSSDDTETSGKFGKIGISIRKAAKHYAKSLDQGAQPTGKFYQIKELLDDQLSELKKRNPERYKEMTDFMASEEKGIVALEGILNAKIRNLLVLKGFDSEWLVKNEFLDKHDLDEEKKRSEEKMKKRWWHFFFKKKAASKKQGDKPTA